MSAFLGPIHYWLYNKIQIQQQFVDEVIKLSEKQKELPFDLREEIETKFGQTETRPLEEVIDQGNIHGWLQQQVSKVEYKTAYSITKLLDYNKDLLKDIETVFENKGKEISVSQTSDNADDIFNIISDCLLDGMPCDNANQVLDNNQNSVTWKRTTCVHTSYWEEVGGDIRNYYRLREAFIRGFLSNTDFVFEKIDDSINRIKRSDVNE